MTSSTSTVEPPSSAAPPDRPGRSTDRRPWLRRWSIAWVLAALTLLLAVALPLAPVVVDTPEVSWPRDPGNPESTSALFMPYRPIDVVATVPCASARELGEAAAADAAPIAVATAPPSSERGNERSLSVTVDGDQLRIVSSGNAIWTGPIPSSAGCSVVVRAEQSGTTVLLRSPGAEDDVLADAPGARVPEVTAFYTELTAAEGPSPTVVAHPDARFQTSPTLLKLLLIALYVLALAACLWWLWRSDHRSADARADDAAPASRRTWRARLTDSGGPGRWWRWTADAGVLVGLGAWTAIGFINTDDYYYSLEARTIGSAGFVGNHFRFFDVPEIPFVLDQYLLAPLTHLSVAPLVLRLPSLAAGVIVWFLLTRQLVPLLVERPHPALRIVSGIAFLAWWLPWNIGTRPESFVTLAWTITLTLVLQAVARRRLWLLGLAAMVAGTAVTITASGLSCAATILVLAPRWWPVVRDSALGRWPSLALVVACGSLPSAIVFGDATLATARTALRVHTDVGPAEPWYDELLRYWFLTIGDDANQSTFARQVAVLGTLVLVLGLSVVLLRTTRSEVATASWSVPALSYLAANAALLPSPTKWTHHFGSLAGPGTLAVTVAVVVVVRRRPDPYASILLAGALTLTAALAFHGGNHQVEYSDYKLTQGLPGIQQSPFTWMLIALAVALVPWALHRRRSRRIDSGRAIDPPSWSNAVVGTIVAMLFASVFVQTGSAALAGYYLRDTWSMAHDTVDTLTGGGGCGFGDSALALTEPALLAPGPSAPEASVEPSPAESGAVPDADPQELAKLAPAGIALWSTYSGTATRTATSVVTPWEDLSGYGDRDFLAVALAGKLGADTQVVAEYATSDTDGPETVDEVDLRIGEPGAERALGEVEIKDQESWQQVVLASLTDVPAGADLVRLRIDDRGFTGDGYVAVTAPYRVAGTPLSDIVGGRTAALDWPIGFNIPCTTPPRIADGMVQDVRWIVISSTFTDNPDIGLLDEGGGSYSTAPEVADVTRYAGYTEGLTPMRNWGELIELDPLLATDAYTVTHATRTIGGWGWWDGAGDGPTPDDTDDAD